MAMRSERQDSRVDPDMGIYVEMEGIMEIRWVSDDVDHLREPEDFFHFQKRVREIPDDFCHKDRFTTEQALFFCLVCNCDLKSLRPLRDHVKGNKHIRKACEKKRQIMGLPAEPPNAPRLKKMKKEKPKVDVGMTLKDRLEDCGEPAIGLNFVTEYWHPENNREIPMYTCGLDGCKSAWGTSDDMFNHVKKPKHHKNFFRWQTPDDNRISGLSNADILFKAAEYEEDNGGCDERDYEVIVQVRHLEKYMELRDRPDDWSQKKANLGLDSNNPNTIPLGKRRGGEWGQKEEESPKSPPMFDPEEWKDWKCPTREEAMENFTKSIKNGVKDVQDMTDDFDGVKGDDEFNDIKFYSEMYSKLLKVYDSDDEDNMRELVPRLMTDIDTANNQLEEKVEKEDREMKHVSKMMSELEEELIRYHSDRDTKKYENVRNRLSEVTTENMKLKPTRDCNKNLKDIYNKRLTELWTGFESRSDSIIEMMEGQVGKSAAGGSSQKRLEERQQATEIFREEIAKYIVGYFELKIGEKFGDIGELKKFADNVVEKKILKIEVNAFSKKETSWSHFKVDDKIRSSTTKYLDIKIKGYTKGDAYRS